MGFSVEVGIPAITVFIQGLLSFSHPACCHLYRFKMCIRDSPLSFAFLVNPKLSIEIPHKISHNMQ